MARTTLLVVTLLSLIHSASASLLAALSCTLISAAAATPRLVIFQMIDDLGWGATGWHRKGQSPPDTENATPGIDALYSAGVDLNRVYGYQMCTPSRTSFMSGRLPLHVQQSLDNPEVPHAGMPREMTALPLALKSAGVRSAIVGKYDIGMATPDHTPEGRGFNSSLIYYEHKNDYFSQLIAQSACQTTNPEIVDLWSNGGPAVGMNGTQYEEYMFRDRVFELISAIQPGDPPMFLYWAPHAAHCPLQVPQDVLSKYTYPDDETACSAQTAYIFPGSTPADYHCRSQYEAIVKILDASVANITQLLKAKGLWNDTLWIGQSDNGALCVGEGGYRARNVHWKRLVRGTCTCWLAPRSFRE